MPYKDPIKAKECRRRYYLRHKSEVMVKAKEWAEDNPKKRKMIMKVDNHKRRFLKRLWSEKLRFDGNATILGGKCYVCSTNKRLHIHHIDGQNGKCGRRLNNGSDNLIVLCITCHANVHNRWHRKEFKEYAQN